jgi:hypothetical protein
MDFSLPAAHFPVALSELACPSADYFSAKTFFHKPDTILRQSAITPQSHIKLKQFFSVSDSYYPHFRSLIISKFVTFS